MAKLDSINYKGTLQEIVPEIAPLFKTTEAYSAGDHVIHDAQWYTFKADKAAGAWDATKVDGPFTVSEDITQLKSEITDKSDTADMLKAFPTDTASGSVASFADGANVPVKSLIVNIDPVQSGSGEPSPDNVRPISGWSEVNVNACGVNVWNEEWELGDYRYADGEPVASSSVIRSKTNNYIPVVPGASYYFKTSGTMDVYYYDNNKAYTNVHVSRNNQALTIPNDVYFIRVSVSGTTYNHDISINYPSTDHDYHPHSGQSINIALGQTVYGGTLDVVSGELVIDYAKITIDGSSAIGQTGSAVSSPVLIQIIPPAQDIAFIDEKTIPRCLCGSYLPPTSAYRIYRSADLGIAINQSENRISRRIWIRLPEVTTEAQAQTYLNNNPIEVVYPIYNPITVQLTPNEVTALLGSNNVWADSGDTAVEYRADPTLYIQRLTEPDADMVAGANIVSGQYFMVGNTLYKATANIASGATISPNVNCTRKSLSEALNELNA